MNIHQKINARAGIAPDSFSLAPILRSWAKNTDKYLSQNITKNNLVKSHSLVRSVVIDSRIGKDYSEFELRYLLYGMFVDMGVGKGRSLGSNRDTRLMRSIDAQLAGKKFVRRKGKRKTMWYSKEMYNRTQKLARSMAEYYAGLGVMEVASKLPQFIEMKF